MAFSEETIQQVWEKATPVAGNDPAVWRQDQCKAWIGRRFYGNRNSEYGWEIDHIVPVSKERLAVLYPFHETKDSKDSADEYARHLAHAIVDTLNAEALAHVQVSFSQMIPSLLELSVAFREASLALKVGKLFYPEQTVFPYNKLGIGRLIYQLPASLCESFLQEVFLDEIPDKLDDETLLTINRFLQNNLNIAETSRQLHMHRNTLIYRLEQIEKRTGLDLRQFEDAMTFKIATMVMNYLHAEKGKNCTAV